jgi:hypothetical protein
VGGLDAEEDDDAPGAVAGDAAPRARRRTMALAIAIAIVVLGGALGVVGWIGRSTYFVGFDKGQVVVWKGRPNGLLWFHPTVELRSGIKKGDLADDDQVAEITRRKVVPDVAAGKAYIQALELRPDDISPSRAASTGHRPAA